MDRFNKEGIQAFVGALEGSGLTTMISNFNQVCAADGVDVFYGGKAADAVGSSKIIFRTGAVTASSDSKDSKDSKDNKDNKDSKASKDSKKENE